MQAMQAPRELDEDLHGGAMAPDLRSPPFAAVPPASDLECQFSFAYSSQPPLQPTECTDFLSMFAAQSESYGVAAMDPAAVLALDPVYTQACILQMCLQDYPEPQSLDSVGNLVIKDIYSLKSDDGFGHAEQGWFAEAGADSPLNLIVSSTASTEADLADDDKLRCGACGRRFAKRTALLRHLRVKHGPKVWHVCHVCGKGLATASSLRYHLCRHTGERLFPCREPGCGAGFMRRHQLLQHLAAGHPYQLAADATVRVYQHVGVDGGGQAFVRAESPSGPGPTADTAAPGVAPEDRPHSVSAAGTAIDDGQGGRSVREQEQHEGLVLRFVQKEPGSWELAYRAE